MHCPLKDAGNRIAGAGDGSLMPLLRRQMSGGTIRVVPGPSLRCGSWRSPQRQLKDKGSLELHAGAARCTYVSGQTCNTHWTQGSAILEV